MEIKAISRPKAAAIALLGVASLFGASQYNARREALQRTDELASAVEGIITGTQPPSTQAIIQRDLKSTHLNGTLTLQHIEGSQGWSGEFEQAGTKEKIPVKVAFEKSGQTFAIQIGADSAATTVNLPRSRS